MTKLRRRKGRREVVGKSSKGGHKHERKSKIEFGYRKCYPRNMAQYFKNTSQKGSVRYIVFEDKEDKCWYAVGLEFNLVIEGDTPQVALFSLFEAINGYLKAFKKIGGTRPHALNQSTESEYEKMWVATQTGKKIESPYSIYTSGIKMIHA